MTDVEETETEPQSSNRSRNIAIAAVVAVVVLGLIVFLVYWFVFRDDSAASVTTDEADQAREQALEEAGVGEQPAEENPPAVEDPPAPDDGAGEASEEATGAGLDGTWTIDTSIGTFDEACLTEVCDTTFVGFRIDEELASIGAKTVVGRSPGVSGSMEIEGTTIVSTEILVDMTQLITDSSSRTGAIRRQAIETDVFPEASFVLTEAVELGALPGPEEPIDVDATGELTIHGVTRTETIPLTAELVGDVIVVFGQLGPILLADYEIDEPQAAVVLSVEDNAT
ncbi:MAG: YceI family protein, partial [Acidimicrobiales bacterium]